MQAAVVDDLTYHAIDKLPHGERTSAYNDFWTSEAVAAATAAKTVAAAAAKTAAAVAAILVTEPATCTIVTEGEDEGERHSNTRGDDDKQSSGIISGTGVVRAEEEQKMEMHFRHCLKVDCKFVSSKASHKLSSSSSSSCSSTKGKDLASWSKGFLNK